MSGFDRLDHRTVDPPMPFRSHIHLTHSRLVSK